MDCATFSESDYDADAKRFAPIFARVLTGVLGLSSVVDVGCGLGTYLAEFERLGLRVRGYDFSPAALAYTECGPGVVILHDLRRPLRAKERYDLCISSEVAEHIEPEYADQFVSTLCGLSDMVYFTAARLGQQGKHHVNDQPSSYWERKFLANGFRLDKDLTRYVMSRMKRIVPSLNCLTKIWFGCLMFRRA